MNKNNILQTIKTIVLATILVFGVGYAQAQFQQPTAQPPQGNVDAPVNVGTQSQTKNGDLDVNNFGAFGNAYVDQDLGVRGNAQLRDSYPSAHSYFDQFTLAVEGDAAVSGIVDSDMIPTLSPSVSSTPTSSAVPTQSYAYYTLANHPAQSSVGTLSLCDSNEKWGLPCLFHYPTDSSGNTVDITVATGQLYQSLACMSKNGELVLCQELYRNYPFGSKKDLTN